MLDRLVHAISKILLLIIITGLVFYFSYTFFYHNSPLTREIRDLAPSPTPRKTETTPISKSPIHPINRGDSVAHSVNVSEIPVVTTPNIHGKNRVEFKIIDGLAVAYGDLILGTPETPLKADHGFTEIAPTEFWDKPEIPYIISGDLSNPERIEKALEFLRRHTVVNFVPYHNQKDVIVFGPGSEHCLSVLGKMGGFQPIKLSEKCGVSEVLHEIMHALGFIHEQSRPDRDSYVQVVWENIDKNFQSQFTIVPEALFTGTLKDSEFDYQSIMLYSPVAFAIHPGIPTLKSTGKDLINPSRELSESDIKRVNRLFHW